MKLLTTAEAAKRLKLSQVSIRKYCQRGRIPGAVRLGTGLRASWAIPLPESGEIQVLPPKRDVKSQAEAHLGVDNATRAT